MEDFLGRIATTEIYGNTPLLWSIAAVCATAVYFALQTVRGRLVSRCEQRYAHDSRTSVQIIRSLARTTRSFFFLAVSMGAAHYILTLPPKIAGVVSGLTTVGVMIQFGIWGTGLLGHWIAHNLASRASHDPGSASAAQIIKVLCLVAIWSAILLLTLSNFGVDITGLAAGLGIGGIAIAFALQSILKDLFASLAIVLDKPFVVGDFIIFGEQLGVVERIGLKTTRVRSLWGEQITVSNDDLLNARVRNYKRMDERRISFDLRVVYETPIEKLEAIPGWIRESIAGMENVRFDRSHVASFDEFGPRIETVYYVLSPDYNRYMDIQQRINLTIARRFAESAIQFAYPTRRILNDTSQDFTEATRMSSRPVRRQTQGAY